MTVRNQCMHAAGRVKDGEPVTVIVDSTGLRFSHAGAWYERNTASLRPAHRGV